MCPPRPPTRHPPTLGEDGGGVACRYARGGTEPTLDELIHEPIIRLLMLRDNVSEKTLSQIIRTARKNSGAWTRGRAEAATSYCPILSTIRAVLLKRGSR
jgi:hypothetical protein